jgi:DNA (cytosine-5)-methyltransferase 1
MKKINLLTLFSGIGSPEQGAGRVYDEVNLVAACEWDKYARESFKANYHIEDEHFHKDINDMDGTHYKGKVDILVGGSPCQDFSLAGLRAGVDGNKGILIYEYIRIIKEVEPPIFIYENVKGMLSDKKGKTIKEFVEAFRDMGYYCHYEVLNTKDYGVPQNRERIFLVGFKDVNQYYNFSFAPKIKLEKRLKDILEDDVDEKYYINCSMISNFSERSLEDLNKNIIDDNSFSDTITANPQRATANSATLIKVPSATKSGYEIATLGDSINLTHPDSKTRRGRVGKQVAQTLDCACNQAVVEPNCTPIGMLDIKGNDSIRRVYDTDGLIPTLTTMECGNRQPKICENIKESVRKNFIRDYDEIVKSDKPIFYSDCNSGFQDNKVCITESACLRANNDNIFALDNNYRIRKLTPRECFRLQDFPDSFKFVVSNSQLYKQAGNSISVNMMEMIFNQIELSRHTSTKKDTLF